MTLDELREQLQENVLTYMDTVESNYLEIDRQWVYDDLCQVIVDTFNDAFYAPAPISLDTATQN
jgi:hypothetical protein